MEEQIIQENTYLNLHSLIKEQPKFWQTCFNKPFDQNETIKELRKAIDKGSDNVEMLSSDSEDFLREIFSVKTSLDNLNKDENEADADFDNRKKVEVESILLNRIVPLIERTFSIDEQLTAIDRQNLINKLTSYPHRTSLSLLNLYLQFLVRNKFFEDKASKIVALIGFHNEIENCEGGMINRLLQYVGDNKLGQITQENLKQFILSVSPNIHEHGVRLDRENNRIPFNNIGDQAHIPAFIQKFLFGQASSDQLAISTTKYIPLYVLQNLCKKAVNGDFSNELFGHEVEVFLKEILKSEDQKDFQEKWNNNNLIKLMQDFALTVRGDRNYLQIELPDNISDIFFDSDFNFRNRSDRQKEIEKFGIKKIFEEGTKGIIENSILKKFSNLGVTNEEKAKLDIIGELYFVLLDKVTYLTEDQFVEKLISVRDLFDKKVVEEKTTFVLKDDSNIPEEIRNYINQHLDELYLDNNNKIHLKKEDSSLKILIPQLKSNQDFLNDNLNDTQLNVDNLDKFKKLYFLINNPLSEYASNLEGLKGKAIFNLAHPNSLQLIKMHISPEQLTKLVGNEIITIPPISDKNISDKIRRSVIEICGPSLIKEFPNQFIDIFSKIEDRQFFAKMLNSPVGKFLAEKHSEVFIQSLKDKNDGIIYDALEGTFGMNILKNDLKKFFSLLSVIKNEIAVSNIVCGNAGKNLAEKNPNEFANFLNVKLSEMPSITFPTILQSEPIKILAKNQPENFTLILDKMINGLINSNNTGCFSNIIESNLGNVLVEKYPDQFRKMINCIKSEEHIVQILSNPDVGFGLLNHQNDLFSEIFNKINNIGLIKNFFESPVGNHFLLVLDNEKFMDLSNKIVRSSSVSQSLDGKIGEVLAERFPKQFMEYLNNRSKNEILKVLKLEAGKCLVESHPQYFTQILNDVLDSNQKIDAIDKIKPSILKEMVESNSFKALVTRAEGGEMVNDLFNIVGKIISGNFKDAVKSIKEIDFIKESLNIEKPKTKAKPKPENTNQLNRKKAREEDKDNNQDGKGNFGR